MAHLLCVLIEANADASCHEGGLVIDAVAGAAFRLRRGQRSRYADFDGRGATRRRDRRIWWRRGDDAREHGSDRKRDQQFASDAWSNRNVREWPLASTSGRIARHGVSSEVAAGPMPNP